MWWQRRERRPWWCGRRVTQQRCEGLATVQLPASDIGLATSGARVTEARWVTASSTGNTNGEYCKVTAQVLPVDATAPPITLEVDLPSAWNRKMLHYGGGGWDGFIPAVGGHPDSGFAFGANLPGVPTPLAQGYVTYGSNSGNPSNRNATFATNDEGRRNYAGDHIKKTHDVAQKLLDRYYGAAVTKSYFVGGSSGGRQAIIAAQRFPDDYDGVMSTYPALQLVGIAFQDIRMSQANLSPGGFINAEKGAFFRQAVMGACDANDGVSDGVISNSAACQFDPSTVRCPGGGDTGNTCLSDAQINLVRTISTPLRTTFAFDQNLFSSPGYNVLRGADFWPTGIPVLGASADPAVIASSSFLYSFGSDMLRYSIARDPSLDILNFNPASPGPLTAAAQSVSALYDGSSTDLSRFIQRGGKLILQHGQSDQVNPTQLSVDYYNRLVARFGQSVVDGFMKFYLVPGAGHGFGSQFAGSYDGLGVLDRWCSNGTTPSNLVITDLLPASNLRTRPLCEFPQWPRFIGGDANRSTSYRCVE